MEKEITEKTVYDMAMEAFGVIPGIVKELTSRSTLVSYLFVRGSKLMEESSFSFKELNVIELKISVLNNCTSCVKGHSYLLKKEGLSESDIKAIIENKILSDERLNKIIRATENIYFAGNNIFPDYVAEDLNNHFSEKQIVEIIGIIGIKTIANYTNNYLAAVNQNK